MSTLTARIDPHLFEETKKIAQKNGINISEYVRIALKLLNEKNRKMARYKQLQSDALSVQDDSLQIYQDFAITDEDLFDD